MNQYLNMKQYADKMHCSPIWIYMRVKRGDFVTKRGEYGQVYIVKEKRAVHPKTTSHITDAELLREVHKLCAEKYVDTGSFPNSLRFMAVKRFGSVRAAKWHARIIHDKKWTYAKFMKCVKELCLKKYKADSEWPENMKHLAKKFCGSIRRAKWEAGVIIDKRKRRIRNPRITKREFLGHVKQLCSPHDVKAKYWTGRMKLLANRFCHTVRGAKWEAGILKDERQRRRS